MFKGAAVLSDVTLSNVAGFAEPTLFSLATLHLKISPLELLSDGILDIAFFEIKGGVLTIERNAEKTVNLSVLQKNMAEKSSSPEKEEKPEEKKEDPQEEVKKASEKESEPSQLKTKISKSRIDFQLQYVDYAVEKAPLRLDLHQILTIQGLTIGIADAAWGNFDLTGGLSGKEDICATSIKGTISPIMNPTAFSFELSGDMANIEPSLYKPYLEKEEISCESLLVQIALSCTDGVFDAKKSEIILAMTDIKLPDNLSKSIPGRINQFDQLSIPIGIRGTLEDPKPDTLVTALIRAVVLNVQDNKSLQKALVDGLGKALGLDTEDK